VSTLSLLVGFPIPFKVTISARLYQSLFRSDRSGSGLYGVWSVLEASCAPLQPSKQKDRLDLVILFVPGGRIGSNCAEPSDRVTLCQFILLGASVVCFNVIISAPPMLRIFRATLVFSVDRCHTGVTYSLA